MRVDTRRQNRKRIGKKYDMYMARATREMIALKAVLLPMLISERSQTHAATSTRALVGNSRRGWMHAEVAENGKPLSRAKAHTSREVEAKQLKKAKEPRTANIETKNLVAGFDPVAW